MKTNCILLFLFVFVNINIFSETKEDRLILDLSSYGQGKVHTFEGNCSYNGILVMNAFPTCEYGIEIKREKSLLPAFNITFHKGITDDIRSTYCNELSSSIDAIIKYQSDENKNEKKLGELSRKLKTILDKNNCDDFFLVQKANDVIMSLYKEYPKKINVSFGEKVTIILSRDTLKWTFVYKGDDIGKWVTTYGFGFSTASINAETFHSKQLADTSLFQIIKNKKRDFLELNYVPAIFFSFFPTQNFNKCWNHSLTAGLGFDLLAPVVFFGYNGLFYQNIGLSAGVVFQQQYRLKDQYSENEFLQTHIEVADLHDKVYRPNLFIAINFRFGENPFKTKQTNLEE